MNEYELHKKLESLKEYKFLKKKLEKLFSEVKVEVAKKLRWDLSYLTLTFDDFFDDKDENGQIFARCEDLENGIITVNSFPIAQFFFEEGMSSDDILLFFMKNNIFEHEIAHIIDYMINGEKEKSKYHDEEFKEILNKIIEEQIQMKNKFDLLFEAVMADLETAKVDYIPAKNIVKKCLIDFLTIPEDVFNTLGDFNIYVAEPEELPEYFDQEVITDIEKAKGEVLIIDLEDLSIDENQYIDITENQDFENCIIEKLHDNGLYNIIKVKVK